MHQHRHQPQPNNHSSSPSTSAVGSIRSNRCVIVSADDDKDIHHYSNIRQSTSCASNSLLTKASASSSSWLPASKLPSFKWSRQFNETLATIGTMLQRNFQLDNYPSAGNVSEASASTATIGSNTAIDAVDTGPRSSRTNYGNSYGGSISSKRHSTANHPNELDMLVLKTNEQRHANDGNDDDSDDSY